MGCKYDWSNISNEVQWIAMDQDGVINGFEKEPLIVHHHKMWFESNDGKGWFMQLSPCIIGAFNWKDSLEERPK